MSYIRRGVGAYQDFRNGVGDYENVQNWTWMHYPPPFQGYAPSSSGPLPTPVLPKGMGCAGGCGCGGTCGGGDGHHHGMGYFTSLDPSTWGVAEWGTVAGLLFVGSKVIGSHPAVRKGRKRVGSAASAGVSTAGNIALMGAAAYGAYYLWNQYQTTGSLVPTF